MILGTDLHNRVARFRRLILVLTLISCLVISPITGSQPSVAANGDEIGPSTFNDLECNLDDGTVGNHASPENAFQISTADQLWESTDCTSSLVSVYFELTNDIDVSDAVHAPISLPIGFSDVLNVKAFTGVLDGKGNKIIGLAMSTTGHGAGLFAHLDDAAILNLGIYGTITSTGGNNGIEPETFMSTGALAQVATGNITIKSVANFAAVSGDYRVGGLLGFVDESTLTISESLNSANIIASAGYVGGLVGLNRVVSPNTQTATVENSYNTGLVSAGIGNAGGLLGITAGTGVLNLDLDSSYNAGTVSSGNANKDGLVMKGSGTTLTSTSFTSQASSYASTTALDNFQEASNLAGFDFADIWGFGTFSDNAGLPILRSNSVVTSFLPDSPGYRVNFDSSGGSAVNASIFNTANPVQDTVTPSLSGSSFAGWSLTSSGEPVAFPYSPGVSSEITLYAKWIVDPLPTPVPYSGPLPTNYSNRTPTVGGQVIISGLRLDLVASCTIDGLAAEVSGQTANNITIVIPEGLEPGLKNLVFTSSVGTLTAQGAFTVRTKKIATPMAREKTNAGSFLGYVAVYAKGHNGSTISWKIAGKWFKTTITSDYQVFQRKTVDVGADVNVDIYIDGVKQLSKVVTTR